MPATVLVVGCPGRCGRPATANEIICTECLIDLPLELGQKLELTRLAMLGHIRLYSDLVLSATEWFDGHRPIAPMGAPNPNAKHAANQLCDCDGPIPGRPYHCAATRAPRENT